MNQLESTCYSWRCSISQVALLTLNQPLTCTQELLIATRHILATDFRRGFQPHLDDLLDESLFLGPGQPASLRPVAYSTIGDLVLHMKV